MLVAEAPEWLVDFARRVEKPAPASAALLSNVDVAGALERARGFLVAQPAAAAGARNAEAYRCAAQCREFGVGQQDCEVLMMDTLNANTAPPLPAEEIERVVRSAYTYARSAQGSAAPEADFTPLESAPENVVELNKQYAYALAGTNGNVLWFTRDHYGNPVVKHLSVKVFHELLAAQQVEIQRGDRTVRIPLTKHWMMSKYRRTYSGGIVFAPEQAVPETFYNLWQGFAVEPAPRNATLAPRCHKALESFLEHVRENVCEGDLELSRWLLGFFAHMIQHPWEKPLTALMFRGEKAPAKTR